MGLKQLLISSALICIGKCLAAAPKAKTLNGTYVGSHLPSWNQDVFLGMPFAQPPLGDLRFQLPQSIEKGFDDERNATQYGFSCMQYGQKYTMSEDCLTINIVRPSGEFEEPLPVLYVSRPDRGQSWGLTTVKCLGIWRWSLLGKLSGPAV